MFHKQLGNDGVSSLCALNRDMHGFKGNLDFFLSNQRSSTWLDVIKVIANLREECVDLFAQCKKEKETRVEHMISFRMIYG